MQEQPDPERAAAHNTEGKIPFPDTFWMEEQQFPKQSVQQSTSLHTLSEKLIYVWRHKDLFKLATIFYLTQKPKEIMVQ